MRAVGCSLACLSMFCVTAAAALDRPDALGRPSPAVVRELWLVTCTGQRQATAFSLMN